MLNIIASFWYIFLFPILITVGVLVGVIISQPRKNIVIQISPDTGRGTQFEVKEEDAICVRCNPVGPIPPQRFVKLQQAYNVVKKGFLKLSNYALWFGMTGTAYTYKFDNKEEHLTLKQAVMDIFGKEDYDKMREDYKKKIEEAKIGVTVEFPRGAMTPANLPSLSSDDLKRSSIDRFINQLAAGINKLGKGEAGGWGKIIFCVGTGIAIGLIIAVFLKVAPPVIVINEVVK